jgi:hypothetical protein
MIGSGNYKVNPTEDTKAFAGINTDDNFAKLRAGGGLSYAPGDGYALDYCYSDYVNNGAEYTDEPATVARAIIGRVMVGTVQLGRQKSAECRG